MHLSKLTARLSGFPKVVANVHCVTAYVEAALMRQGVIPTLKGTSRYKSCHNSRRLVRFVASLLCALSRHSCRREQSDSAVPCQFEVPSASACSQRNHLSWNVPLCPQSIANALQECDILLLVCARVCVADVVYDSKGCT